tara:strand:+ start:2201 stop:2794 length:594 start_codon:yes stop_codon:yes gene_type:complete
MYYTIKPKGNRSIGYTYVCTKIFDNMGIQKIIDSLEKDWFKSEVVQSVTNEMNDDLTKQRVGNEQPLKIIDEHFPYPQISNSIAEINSDYWKFDITGFDMLTDQPQVFRYDVGGKFDWHFDVGGSSPTRKLGFTLQLSDSDEYEGGDLEFFGQEFDKRTREKGTLIIFPSFVFHRVTEITKGRRFAVVGWAHGPTFQ